MGAITSSGGFIDLIASPWIGLLALVHAALPRKEVTVIPGGNISMGFAVVLLIHFACVLLCHPAFVFPSAAASKFCRDLAQRSQIAQMGFKSDL